jgi:hypothetical protein
MTDNPWNQENCGIRLKDNASHFSNLSWPYCTWISELSQEFLCTHRALEVFFHVSWSLFYFTLSMIISHLLLLNQLDPNKTLWWSQWNFGISCPSCVLNCLAMACHWWMLCCWYYASLTEMKWSGTCRDPDLLGSPFLTSFLSVPYFEDEP